QAEMPKTVTPATLTTPPCALVVFGAAGDLSHRKLMPALYNLDASGVLSDRLTIVGVGRQSYGAVDFRAEVRKACDEFSRRKVDQKVWSRFAPRLEYVAGEFDDPQCFERLSLRLQQLDLQHQLGGNRLFYLAVPPAVFETILKGL